jgi:hypothetical protein
VDGDREVPLEEAVPGIFREAGGEEDGDPEVRRQEARQSIVRRFALHRMLTSASEVAAWYGLTEQEAEEILRELELLGALVCIPAEATDSAVTSSPPHLLTSSSARWGSPEHLEGAYVATLARRRREARPATVAQYQQFLAGWQRRSGAPLAGEEGVREVLAQLQGLPLPAPVWEGEVLARRVRPYQPPWLDHVCQTGEFFWQGSAGSFSGRGRIAFFHRELFPAWPISAAGPVTSGERAAEGLPTTADLSPLAQRVAAVLARRGASFQIDLALAIGTRGGCCPLGADLGRSRDARPVGRHPRRTAHPGRFRLPDAEPDADRRSRAGSGTETGFRPSAAAAVLGSGPLLAGRAAGSLCLAPVAPSGG